MKKIKQLKLNNTYVQMLNITVLILYVFLFSISIFSINEFFYFIFGGIVCFINFYISNLYIGKKLENARLVSFYRNINNIMCFITIGLYNYKNMFLLNYLLAALLGFIFIRYSYIYLLKGDRYV